MTEYKVVDTNGDALRENITNRSDAITEAKNIANDMNKWVDVRVQTDEGFGRVIDSVDP